MPNQDLAECSFFRVNVEAAQAWALSLPVANTKAVVQELRRAISELNRVAISPDIRFNIMEILRPSLNVAIATMSRRFLSQALVMPEEPRQMSELADNLYSLTATAYTIVAIETVQQREDLHQINPARLLCEALQRALSFTGKKMLQTLQLHQNVPSNGWLELHQLYAMAERQHLSQLPVEDRLEGSRTIETTYLQSLLLGCCKPNQLRQSDLAAVYRGLQEWASLIQMATTDNGSGLYLVDLSSDLPAEYSSLHINSHNPSYRTINTEGLVSHLEALKTQTRDPVIFGNDISLPPNMLDHLINSLGSMSTRNFSRSKSSANLGITLGLSSTHYHLAGKRTLDQILFGNNYTAGAADRLAAQQFLTTQESRDTWEQANPNDVGRSIKGDSKHQIGVELIEDGDLIVLEDRVPNELSPQERYTIYPVKMLDTSPGGYCLEWEGGLPSHLRTGDIVSVSENNEDHSVIAVIRWISQLEDANSLLGVELLSPRGMPYGARIQQKRGTKAPVIRVLLLPEIKLVGQPHTLLTPRAGFKENQKVTLLREGEEFLVQLLRQMSATGNFAQFDFRYIKHLEQVVAEDKSGLVDSAFDSMWSNI
ncbi:MAG: hypothetical protein ACJAUG_002627 [Halioglobus sp.]